MKDNLVKLFGVAEKIKTPLALSGVVVIVLYLLFKQVLSLNVFSNIGSTNTFVLLQNILSMVFWLAVVTIVLGIGSYILAMVLKHQIDARASNVRLIDARLDQQDSHYEESGEDNRRQIRPKRQEQRKG